MKIRLIIALVAKLELIEKELRENAFAYKGIMIIWEVVKIVKSVIVSANNGNIYTFWYIIIIIIIFKIVWVGRCVVSVGLDMCWIIRVNVLVRKGLRKRFWVGSVRDATFMKGNAFLSVLVIVLKMISIILVKGWIMMRKGIWFFIGFACFLWFWFLFCLWGFFIRD